MNLVTGATGFVGSALTRRLLAGGQQVRLLVRDSDRLPPDLRARALDPDDPAVELHQADLHSLDDLKDAGSGCRRAYHCAALLPDRAPASDFLATNGAGTHNLFLSLRAAEVERVLLFSDAAAAGPSRSDVDRTETDPMQPGPDPYARSKAVQEEIAAEFVGLGLPTVIVRPGLIYGPGGHGRLHDLAQAVLRASLTWPGDPGRYLNCVYVEDVVDGAIQAALRGEPGRVYHLGGHNLTLHELTVLLGRLSGGRPPRRYLPAGLVGALSGTWRYLRGGHEPALSPQALRHYLYSDWRLSSERARTELGYAPSDLEETWRTTLESSGRATRREPTDRGGRASTGRTGRIGS